jgi:hypothetical protein
MAAASTRSATTGQIWSALPDVLAAAILSEAPVAISRVIRIQSVGQQEGLRPVKLRGRLIDPSESLNPFVAMIEERHRSGTQTTSILTSGAGLICSSRSLPAPRPAVLLPGSTAERPNQRQCFSVPYLCHRRRRMTAIVDRQWQPAAKHRPQSELFSTGHPASRSRA